jgi:EmrB/QacA subfamily drug resistance transporter
VTGGRGRWAALGVLCASLLVIVIDNTIVNVALPTLARDLGAETSELQWVVDAYTLVFAGLLLLAGTLGDRFGRRRTLLWGLAVFGLASTGAAFAGGVDPLIATRAVMGAGAAFVMPATLSLVVSLFADARERAMAVGIWAATAGLGVALGPVVGGVLLDRLWWGSIFVVNVPICAVAIVAGRRLVPESRDPVARRIDWTGAALSGVALIACVWAVIEAPSEGWTSPSVLGAGAIAAVAAAAFVAQQRRATEPLLDLRLFRNPRFTAASGTIMVLFFALFGFLFLATQYLQFVLGLSPSAAGVRVLPYAGAMIVFATLSAKLVGRFGTRHVVTAGMLAFSAGLAVAATVGTGTGYGRLAIALVVMGAGMGLAGAPATESISGSLPPERANVGSAVNDTTRELGGALGVAIVGSIMSSLYATQLTEALPERVPPPVLAAARQSLAAAVQASAAVADPAREAFVHAMSRASILVALIAAAGALIARRYLPGFVAPLVAGTADGDTESEASPSPLRPRPDPARAPRSTITPLRTTALRLAAASHDEEPPGGK